MKKKIENPHLDTSGSTTKSLTEFMEREQNNNNDENTLLSRFDGLNRNYQGPLNKMPDLGESVENNEPVVIKLTQEGANFLNSLRMGNDTTMRSFDKTAKSTKLNIEIIYHLKGNNSEEDTSNILK